MSNTGITVPGTADFIVVKLDYSRKLIFSIDTGLDFIRAYMGGIQIKSEWNKDDQIGELEKLEIEFMTQADLNGLLLMKAVDPNGTSSEET